LRSGGEIWNSGEAEYLAFRFSGVPGRSIQTKEAITDFVGEGVFVVGKRLPQDFLRRYNEVEAQVAAYQQQTASLRTYRNMILLTLGLFTVLVLFSSMWFALFLSKQVTVPIEALAEGTREVARGNLGHQVDVAATDELGTLVSSFNQMTGQLADSRRQVDEFTRSLQQALQEIEQRRQLMETIQENIPTGVLSLDASGAITRANRSVARIFGDEARKAASLAQVMGDEAARAVEYLMRKALRLGAASKEIEIALGDRLLHAAVTVSALGPRRSNPGYVVVIDDLTDLLRAQKAAAWQEVAQRIAHEIKNPLTPIQLSAQRLSRHLERADAQTADAEFSALARECTALIEREVATLKSLVDEFSQFARFPASKPEPAEINAIVSGALDVFAGRLDGVHLRTDLAEHLPQVKADPELMRRVLINLVDNAAEAMEGATYKELTVATRLVADGDTVEIVVADSGHGISPEDKDKLFLPRFSTRGRGTGLGLAIAARIVADHGGAIRAEDNSPVGAKFIVRLPAIEVPATQRTGDD
jgi:PAS domain S-box-containing protein